MDSPLNHDDRLALLAEQARQHFLERYGRLPTSLVAAPGRVNMIGDHVDYNQGLVLPFAIDRYTVVASDRVSDSALPVTTVSSTSQKDLSSINLAEPIVPLDRDWSNYVRGVIVGFLSKGVAVPAMDMLIHSSVPTGSGLSSSAALEVAVATSVEVASGVTLDKKEKALLCQEAEHDFAGVPCGVMDQFVSVFGREGFMLEIDCQDLSTKYVEFNVDDVSLVVVNSSVQHELATGEYALRRQTCDDAAASMGLNSLREIELDRLAAYRNQLSETQFRRTRHVVTENKRTLDFVAAITNQRFAEAGQLLYQSHASLRDDYEVSCLELNQLVELAQGIGLQGGVYGARMTGGGFGGAMIMLTRNDSAERVARNVVDAFNRTRQADQKPAAAFVTDPSQGAHVL